MIKKENVVRAIGLAGAAIKSKGEVEIDNSKEKEETEVVLSGEVQV